MYALVEPFVQIALLRAKPQDLPWSRLLLGLVLATHMVMGSVIFSFRLAPAQALGAGFVGSAVLVVLTVSLLYVNRLGERAIQTVTALAGADVVIGLVALPLEAALRYSTEQGGPGGITGLLSLIILFWNLAVTGHVLRHALNAPLPLGIVISLIFFILSVSVHHSLFPTIG